MAIYRYTQIGSEIPAISIVPLELIQPGRFEQPSMVGQAILDTGSDCTLTPIPWLMQVNAQVAYRPIRIPVGGLVSLAIPYEVGLRFDQHCHLVFRVYGCSVDEIGDLAIVGRDLLNLYVVEFNGLEGTFSIS